jgi:hypothetical protein
VCSMMPSCFAVATIPPFRLVARGPILTTMLDGGRESVGRGPRLGLLWGWAALLAWLLLVLGVPGDYIFLRGWPTGRTGEVELCCPECGERQWHPELPPPEDDRAWVCKNRRHKGGPQDRVAVYRED